MTLPIQPGILAEVPAAARYLTFRLRHTADPRTVPAALAAQPLGEWTVVGLGEQVLRKLGTQVEGLRELPALAGRGVSSPSTPCALWCWMRGDDPGELLHRGRDLTAKLAPAFELEEAVSAFRYEDGHDLSGYEDGTENPTGTAALEAGFVHGRGPGLDGSSFVAVQRWVHDLDLWSTFSDEERDAIIGRRRSDNVELEDAPPSAHVKRTEQEGFEPPAFVLRRSMPWADRDRAGLMFVSFARSLDPFELQMRRMLGLDDGVVDGLFRFTRPQTGRALWCPPVADDGSLDLSAIGF